MLNHSTYNVGSGRATRNAEVAEAIKQVIPDATIELPGGCDPAGSGRPFVLDITWIHQDTGHQPEYDNRACRRRLRRLAPVRARALVQAHGT